MEKQFDVIPEAGRTRLRGRGGAMAGDNGAVSFEVVFLAIVAGALAGAVTVLLSAPQSRQEARELLRVLARRALRALAGTRDIKDKETSLRIPDGQSRS